MGVLVYWVYPGEKKRNRHHPIKESRFRILSTSIKPYIARMAIKVHVPAVCGEVRAGDKFTKITCGEAVCWMSSRKKCWAHSRTGSFASPANERRDRIENLKEVC